jgi:flagellar protein FliO/FliZ
MDILQQAAAVVVAVFAVSLLAAAAIWIMKRLGTGRPPQKADGTDDLRFVRAVPVGPRERLVVMAWGAETLLLGVTSGGVTLLTARPRRPDTGESSKDHPPPQRPGD